MQESRCMSLEYQTNNVGLTGIRTKISALSLLTVKLYFSLNSRGQADHEGACAAFG